MSELFAQLANQLFLAGGEVFRDIYHNAHQLIAPTATVDIGDTLIPQLEYIAGLGTGGNAVFHLAVQGWHLQLIAQRCLRKADGDIAPDIIAIPFKERVRAHIDAYAQISGGTAVDALIALTAHIENLAVIDTGGNIDLDFYIAADSAVALTFAAGGGNNRTLAAAARTGFGGLNDAERRSMLRRAVIACGLAKVPSNAEHLIKESIDEVDYDSAYVVVVDNFRFNQEYHIRRLYELAAKGLAVIVGTKAVPARYEWITQTLY